jgi:hypothetical protein
MKEEFYCLALRKKVTTKVTGVAKKKGYSLKGLYKEGGKEYKVTKTCSKAKAEEVAQKLGLDIEQQVVEIKESESSEPVVPADDFIPEGDGKVIGQNTAGVSTAIEGTQDTVTSNTTPLHAESPDPTDDDDNIGPMSMASESESLDSDNCSCGCSTGSCSCPPGCKCGCTDIATGITHESESKDSEGGGGMDYAIEPDHWLRLQAHPEWKEWAPEVNVSRESNYWVITCPDVSADDILELIIATAESGTEGSKTIQLEEGSKNRGLALGFGLVGLAASLILIRNLNKGEE